MVVGGGAEFLHNNRKHQIYQFPKQKELYYFDKLEPGEGGIFAHDDTFILRKKWIETM